MSKASEIRDLIMFHLGELIGTDNFRVVVDNELCYEVKIRSSDGSFLILSLNKDEIGRESRITLEIYSQYTISRYNTVLINKRFHGYEDVYHYLNKYGALIGDMLHCYLGFKESSGYLAKV